MTDKALPTLYSFRRCPYAMRARLALAESGVKCELREVVLKDKPEQLLTLSPKGTVPVLVTAEGQVIDESIDIAFWALTQHDPDNWYQSLSSEQHETMLALIENNDGEFKYFLDRYKYADRYPEHSQRYYREQGEKTLTRLEQLLTENGCLLREYWTLADIALLPFIRQFAFVDKAWFDTSAYPRVQAWLADFLESDLFRTVMPKYPQWHEGDEPVLFP
ncbi:glutathione S-transferase [Methylophaga sp.]|jgi:glutathione S-transferase|uniref:glutathione S-transferase n=1 Tax=Methylophaga sp. TaxID=2024840 RepID=UPI0013FE7B23|nr:glutathione S-transferase [Methylophaga sp.]MTI63220.1 glutathione S-transferase [Methylophaga sp.]